MKKKIIIPEVAAEIRKAYESSDMPSMASLADRFSTTPAVVSFAIQEAGGEIRPRGKGKGGG